MKTRTCIALAVAGGTLAVLWPSLEAAAADAGTPAPAPAPAASGVDAQAKAVPSSAPGDYIGDCFTVYAPPAGSQLEAGRTYIATQQRDADNDDRALTLVDGEVVLGIDSRKWMPGPACRPARREGGPGKPVVHDGVLASTLIGSGATRQGYAYGFLTMPYKYFPGEKHFEVNVPIGGYFGWRWGQAGSGATTALALTLSTVRADTVDPTTLDANGRPTKTGTTDTAALSFAAGLMFDVLKSPRGRPFKAGVFIGRDVTGKSETVDYRFDRKTWIALQLGYDFTDN